MSNDATKLHALDRIRQHYSDNDLTDSELVALVGERLIEVYGLNYRDTPSMPETGEKSALPARNEGEARCLAGLAANRESAGVVTAPTPSTSGTT